MRKLSDMIVYIGKQKMYPLLIVFFLGIAFFFILGQLYYSVRKKAYCEKLERTFKEVLLRQLQEDSFEGYLSTSERKRQLEEYPDTVYLTDESGEHGYYLDREKSRRNIAHDPRLRILHSAYLVEHPLVVDSLYGKWQQHLEQQKMFTAFALQFFLSDKDGNTTSCVFPNDLLLEDYIACFDITIGYRCEVELKGFCSFSFFDLVGTRGIIYAFIYWLLIITSIIAVSYTHLCLLSVIFIPVTGRDAARPGQWTSMICWCILISCSVISRMCWRIIVISSVMCWWTSIKIRTMRSTALSCN